MEYVIDHPQVSDMGSGYGHIEGCEDETLLNVLNWIYAESAAWGTITIYSHGQTIRKFDYDLHAGNNFFYHKLNGYEKCLRVKNVESMFCFCNEDWTIYIK